MTTLRAVPANNHLRQAGSLAVGAAVSHQECVCVCVLGGGVGVGACAGEENDNLPIFQAHN